MSSCRKEDLPENTIGDAVFYLSGQINGQMKTFIAGDDEFYMYTSTEISNGIHLLEGDLNNGKESVKIQFFRSPQSNMSLELGEYQFLNYNKLIEQVYVDSISESAITSFEWIINGTPHQQINIDSLIDEPGKYEICLTINYNNSCSKSICSDYMIGMSTTYDMDFNYKLFNDSTVQCVPQIISQNNVRKLEWYLNGSYIQESGVLDEKINPGIHTVDMVVEFNDGLTLTKSKNIRFNSQDCFFEEIRITSNPEFDVESGILITYTSPDGVKYSNYSVNQTQGNVFNLTKNENYKPNQNQQSVKKLTVNFDVLLKSTDGSDQLLTLNGFFGKFGIAHP